METTTTSQSKTFSNVQIPKKHLFFDLDNTVSRSRSKLSPALKAWLKAVDANIIIVSGAVIEQITYQMDGVPCYKLGQSGNHAVDPEGNCLWEARLCDEDKATIMEHVAQIPRDWEVSDESDLIQDRGCQISYSLFGHNEVLEKKEAFDPDGSKRMSLLAAYPFESEKLQVKIGGTTNLDYTVKGKHKGFYVAKFLEYKNWDKADAIYFGDRLFPGGNDESVIGVIDTQAVTDPADTLAQLQESFN